MMTPLNLMFTIDYGVDYFLNKSETVQFSMYIVTKGIQVGPSSNGHEGKLSF
jgi:hypothetical protein